MARHIIFAGDSITDAGHGDSHPPFGNGFVAILERALASESPSWQITNAGIAGNRAIDLERRWGTDVEAIHPDTVSILIGINDVWRRYSDDEITTIESFENSYRRILDHASEQGTRVIMCEPFLIPLSETQQTWFADLDPKRLAVRRLASEYGHTFIPLHDLITGDAKLVGKPTLTTDGVHLTEEGHRRIANHWLTYAGLEAHSTPNAG
jgi:lysophospholipase L1-like esterase